MMDGSNTWKKFPWVTICLVIVILITISLTISAFVLTLLNNQNSFRNREIDDAMQELAYIEAKMRQVKQDAQIDKLAITIKNLNPQTDLLKEQQDNDKSELERRVGLLEKNPEEAKSGIRPSPEPLKQQHQRVHVFVSAVHLEWNEQKI